MDITVNEIAIIAIALAPMVGLIIGIVSEYFFFL